MSWKNIRRVLTTQIHIKNSYESKRCVSNQNGIKKTALYDFHVKNGGKIINFGGYALPVVYADQTIAGSHLYTRQFGSLFDVSHMQQTYLRGKNVIDCFESICTADLRSIPNGSSVLTIFTNDNGGILDDLIVTKLNNNKLFVVSNAAMKQQDMQIIEAAVCKYNSDGKDVSVDFLSESEQSLISIQGPKIEVTLSKFLPSNVELNKLYFMNSFESEIAGVPNCRITRCGYTGEDGVEISIPSVHVRHVVEALLSSKEIKLAGLGARDTLRLEAGLCLYGSDIDSSTTPVEAGLSWLVAKVRREELNFPGAQQIKAQLIEGPSRNRIGLTMVGSQVPPARSQVEIYSDKIAVGKITSGCPSPSLGKNIAMGYISTKYKKPGTLLTLCIRNKFYEAVVTKMPFVKTNYYMKEKRN